MPTLEEINDEMNTNMSNFLNDADCMNAIAGNATEESRAEMQALLDGYVANYKQQLENL